MTQSNLYSYAGLIPKIGESVYIAPSAQVIGNVTMGNNSSIWFNSVARGDVNQIIIGENTNIQDLCMLHITEVSDLIIGSNVSVGHSVTLHGCTIGNSSLIGMGATVLDDAIIGEQCLVAAGSIVTPRKEFPARHLIQGFPAKAVRELTEEEIKFISYHYKSYNVYKDEFLKSCKPLSLEECQSNG